MAADLLAEDTHWLTVYPDGTVQDAVDPDNDDYDTYCPESRLYWQMVLAGYPVWLEPGSDFHHTIDLLTDGRTVVARTGLDGGQVEMPAAAAELFLAWFRTAQPDREEP